jgi:hypothetical protein
MNYDLGQIANQFVLSGIFISSKPYGSGHINDTFLTVFDEGGIEGCYIIQRINHEVFKKPQELMGNIITVTEHIRKKPLEENVTDVPRQTLTVVPACDDNSFYKDNQGNYWRCYNFIPNAVTYDVCNSLDVIEKAAAEFGNFQCLLADLPAKSLHETIPNFHNSPLRFEAFRTAVEKDVCARVEAAQKEIDFLFKHACIFDILPKLVEEGEMPIRITHNDTKINNVMFDNTTGKALCVIDLDTVMPGLSLFDFGDIVRTTISDAEEDERNLSKVTIDISRFKAIVKGYLSSAGVFLNEIEVKNLLLGAKTIILEQAVRFLTDHIAGDTYYKTHRSDQNLDRTRTQIRLYELILEHEKELNEIINKCSGLL